MTTCHFRNCPGRTSGSTIRPDGIELLYCVAHEAIARNLPLLRPAACCASEGCGRPRGQRSPLCRSCRPRYSAWGLDGHLPAQEAPMTEPITPPAEAKPALAPNQTREVQVWRGQDWVDCDFSALKAGDLARMREDSASEWGSDTFRATSDAYLHPTPKGLVWTVDAVPMPPVTLIPEVPHVAVAPKPPTEPQEAAGVGATPSGGYLACITPGCGDEDLMDLDQTTGLCGMCTRQKEREVSEGAPLPPIFQPLDPGIQSAVELLRLEGLSTTDSGDGYSKKEAIEAGEALDYAHVFIQVDQGFSAAEVADIAGKIPWTDYGYQMPTVELLARAPDSAADEPDIVALHWPVGQLHTPKPAAEVTEADFEPPHPLETRRDALVVRLHIAGFTEGRRPAKNLRRFHHDPKVIVLIPDGHPCEVEGDFATLLDKAEEQCAKVEQAKAAPKPACTAAIRHVAVLNGSTDAPAPDGAEQEAAATLNAMAASGEWVPAAYRAPADDGEPSVGDVDDAPLFVGGTATAPAELVARWGHKHTAPVQPMSAELDGLAALAARGQPPTAPGPTVAELQAAFTRMEELLEEAEADAERERKRANEADGLRIHAETDAIAERARADLCDAEAVSQRQRADAAEEQLRAIAALLDPEDAPAFDANDQPIPLPRRVQTALMPDPIGKSELERRITKALDIYNAPPAAGGPSASVYQRVLTLARHYEQTVALKDTYSRIVDEVEWIVHHCGSYGGTTTLSDRLLRLLPVERQRAILELKRSEAYIEVARINARFMNPPPPGVLEGYEARVAALDARIAALDAEKVRE